MTLLASIEKLINREHLDSITCEQVLTEILSPETNPLQTAAFLVLLRSKPETSQELAGLVSALKKKMLPLSVQFPVLDIVGTGGDNAKTINISSGSAILAASCGVKVAKHGNRAVTSLAGSADVFEALGININLSAEKISQGIKEIGIGFCYAPNFHPVMQALKDIRKQLKIATTFNILGPLLNPANPQHILLGVYNPRLLQPMAQTLIAMGAHRSIVVHGCGLDEMSCIAPSQVYEINSSQIRNYMIDPQTLGFEKCQLDDLQGGDAQTNANMLLQIFSANYGNDRKLIAMANTLILNAGVALYLYGLHDSLAIALEHARENLLNLSASNLLKQWVAFTND